MTTPEEIADKLSEAQRRLLLDDMPTTCDEAYRPARKLIELDLVEGGSPRYGSFVINTTPLGLAVRALLSQEEGR